MASSNRPRVVILGAGFGGLTAAKALSKDADVTVVDRHNFQTFLPLLYQVATAGLAADHVAHPVRGALRKSGVKFRMGSPISVDHKNKSVKLDSSEVLEFDHLIVALGSATADFGVTGVNEHALGMKSVHEAIGIRAEVMRRFEDLCRFEDQTRLSLSVVGGGPTGVEMAGALAELKRGPLKNDEANAAEHIDIYLIEAGPRILPMFSEKLSARAKKDLEKLGVKVLLNTAVQQVKPRQILVKDGSVIPSEVTIWAAGVKGEPTGGLLNLPLEGTRISVAQNLQVNHYPHIWAIGDISSAKGADGGFLPMVAPVAMQQGRWVAKQIMRAARGHALQDFKYLDKGSMATIGRHKAVVQFKGIQITGIPAWYAWLWLHLFYLLGGRNKIGTIADWTWNYLTFDRGNRHIMDSL
ncbi:NAD(P)/FAD-dependent oxidoreductase [Candidatus Planktophila lacus]|uniref:NADH:ubiquinone reductase (non-electrogenic) n=1 Tax=Candidatus Planktophila lacus TaxID=1884913 RepID=A0AAD0E3E7_9ACTN|nr:NAD(P)/FAD-dependent oxidoreductase [Candidatus Planktophila lacus]ASY10083.1 NADH dehydrogenase [Candidatus Planktophila lacus]